MIRLFVLFQHYTAVDLRSRVLTHERAPLNLASGGSTASEMSPMMALIMLHARLSWVMRLWLSAALLWMCRHKP